MGKSNFKLVDLFSGAGGLSLGFSMAGFKVIGAIDNFENACETFRENHKNINPAAVICDDITKVKPQKASNF